VSENAQSLGRVIAVRGSQASVGLASNTAGAEGPRVTVGKFLGISAGRSLQIGVVTDVTLRTEPVSRDKDYITVATLDIIGEISGREDNTRHFRRGVSDYPAIGDDVTSIASQELRLIFNIAAPTVINVGSLQQDSDIGAYVDIDEMLSKHFAVLGTTGVGKSSGVALLVQRILQARSEFRVLILDVHNEYRPCFGDRAQVMSPRNLKLPFWLFNFEEITDIFFGARPGLEEELDILSEVIPLAKATYSQGGTASGRIPIKRADSGFARYTVDIPVPYRITDVLAILDERMGKLENRSSRMIYHKLISRIESVSNDARYSFMFENANIGGDTMAEILGVIFRHPPDDVPITIMQLAGFPSEVVDAVVSVLCRMAFDLGLWSDGLFPLLVVCEEAHRYISADHRIGFGPTRRAISRIAKEGRKYNVHLGLISQRPAELDPTILSQCSTLFAMRMTNDRDQEIMRSAVSDTAANLLSFLPSLGTGEVFAFGEGVAVPTRLRLMQLPAEVLPKSEATGSASDNLSDQTRTSMASVVERWRRVMGGARSAADKPSDEAKVLSQPAAASLLRRGGNDPDPLRRLNPADRGRL
jgi:uncharacterized protein